MLDDFYYSIYKNSLLFVKGIGTATFGMTFGTDGLYDMSDINKLLYFSDAETKTDQDLLTGPYNPGMLCDVRDCAKDELTGYAIRDGEDRHKIVAYMVIDGANEVKNGDRITVGLREHWSQDWYLWQTEPLRGFSLPAGSLYTLDFTKKAGDRNLYQSFVAINTTLFQFTHMATMNLGAKSLTDAGEYYMFGYNTPILPGGKYPNAPNPTPFFCYDEDESSENARYALAFGNANETGASGYIGGRWVFMDGKNTIPKTYDSKNDVYIGTTNTHGKVYVKSSNPNSANGWWREWATALKDLPNPIYEWSALPYKTKNAQYYLSNSMERTEVIYGDDGAPVAIKLIFKRTGHCVIVPVSGWLEPSITPSSRHIGGDVTARVSPGTEKYAFMAGYCFFMPKAAKKADKKVQMVGYYIDTDSDSPTVNVIPLEEKILDLYMAMPVRPSFYENAMSINRIFGA